MDNDERLDKDIEELRADARRFRALEAQVKLIRGVLAAVVASVLGIIGTRIQKWDAITIDLSDLRGELHAHEREAAKIVESMGKQLDECHDDLKDLMTRPEPQNNQPKR